MVQVGRDGFIKHGEYNVKNIRILSFGMDFDFQVFCDERGDA